MRLLIPSCGLAPAPAAQRNGRSAARSKRAGMSLIELVVGIVVLTIGLLGLAGVSTSVIKQMRGGVNQTIAASMAQSRFEKLEGLRCVNITGGAATSRGLQETWAVTPVGTRGMAVRDTVSFAGISKARKVGISTVVSCQP